VFRSNTPKIANFRTDYAKHADFSEIFERDTRLLYLLAFLLTTNHKESEQCFALTIEEALKEQTVFKEWARSWVRRRMIENAIEIVSPAAARKGQQRDLWSGGQRETHRECEIDTVTKLAPFERFVFVMAVLECYSNWDCAVLLGCSMNRVAQTRIMALRRLPGLAALLPRGDGLRMRRLGVPA
jgi:DNA-directed RNA polymerase specialized sigma24 family protein